MRIITISAPLSHTDPLIQKISVLKVQDMNKLQIANFMSPYLHTLLQQFLDDSFKQNCIVVPYNTRQSNHINIPNHV